MIQKVKHEGAWDWSYGWGRTDTMGFDLRANTGACGLWLEGIWAFEPVPHWDWRCLIFGSPMELVDRAGDV